MGVQTGLDNERNGTQNNLKTRRATIKNMHKQINLINPIAVQFFAIEDDSQLL